MLLKRFTVIISICTAAVVMLVWTSVPALAILKGYTDHTSFMSDLPTSESVLDFDDMTYGDIIASGDTVGGITFAYDFSGVQMMVTDDAGGVYPTTSSPNLLGTDDADMFQDGDDFDLSFAPASAIGMYFITADQMADDDITLTAGGGSIDLLVSSGVDLGDDWYAYFLGIIDVETTFTTASITTIGEGYFLYNVDDITTATSGAEPVPEPGTLLLLGTGLLGLFYRMRRHP